MWKEENRLAYQWNLLEEEGREEIHKWSQERQQHFRGINKTYHGFLVHTFNLKTIKNFLQNFNFMVIIQMILAGLSIYIFQRFDIYFDMNVYLYLSPIVFPLAFSINTDFQRREKVLEDLANFKTGCMFWFFASREWKEVAGLDEKWMTESYAKLKRILFYLREYLLTERIDRRKVILNAMYEDVSDCSQLIETVRASKLPTSDTIVLNQVTVLQAMTLSFERLRVVREYRSPRSIRSFNKVLILLLPIIIAPYFVNQSRGSAGKVVHSWAPYYTSILVSFVFSALQGVQDKLDDPFDGMSEDDINLEQIDEWTFHSLQATANRTFKVGRFQVNNVDCQETLRKFRSESVLPFQSVEHISNSFGLRRSSSGKVSSLHHLDSTDSSSNIAVHPYADVLEKIQGDKRIEKGGIVRPVHGPSTSHFMNVAKETITPEDLHSECACKADANPIHDIHKRVSTLEGLLRTSKDKKINLKKRRYRTISFNDSPITITARSSFSEHSLDIPGSSALTQNSGLRRLAGTLLRLKRKPSSSSESPPSTPRSPETEFKSIPEVETSKEIEKSLNTNLLKPHESIVYLPERLEDSDARNELEKVRLLPFLDDEDFVVVDRDTRLKDTVNL